MLPQGLQADLKALHKGRWRVELKAAPSSIGKNAKVIQIGEDGQMRIVREGKNNFTCMADNPVSPGNDPDTSIPYIMWDGTPLVLVAHCG